MANTRPSAWSKMWFNFFSSFNKNMSKNIVGSDKFGNKYYVEDASRVKAVTRGFIPARKDADGADNMWAERHPLWEEWLRNRRHTVPSPAEMAAHDANFVKRMMLARANDMRIASEQSIAPTPDDDMAVIDKASGRRTAELKPKIAVRTDETANVPRSRMTAYPHFDDYERDPGKQKIKGSDRDGRVL